MNENSASKVSPRRKTPAASASRRTSTRGGKRRCAAAQRPGRVGKTSIYVLTLILIFTTACSRTSTTTPAEGPIEVSGLIEGDEITISSEIAGTIAEIRVAEGDQVRPGDVLVRLDDTILQAQLAEAWAQVNTAQVSRDLVAAGPRPGEIAAGRAAVASAQAARDGALQAWHNAIVARNTPQELDGRIAATSTELEKAIYQVEQARLALQAAELERDQTEEGSDLRRSQEAQVRAAVASLAAAEAARDGTQTQLNQLHAIRKQPLAAEAQVRAAAGQYAIAAAELRLAQARLAELEAGPSDAGIAVADAMVRQAQAAANILIAQQRLTTIAAPSGGRALQGYPVRSGSSALPTTGSSVTDSDTVPAEGEHDTAELAQVSVVTAKIAQQGETIAPGAPILTLTRLDPLYLTLYIPTDRIGQVNLGQPVEVRVDSFPSSIFLGQVVYISPRAEFTPHNLQAYEERVNAVFAVRVRLPNADGRLKPGMPADAVIE